MKWLACVGLLAVLGLANPVLAEDSNQRAVRKSISRGGWTVIYGEKITEAEYIGLSAAIAASVASENPGPVLTYLESYVDRTVAKLKGKLPDLTKKAIRQLVEKAIVKDGGRVRLGQIDLKFGIATYKRWKRVVYHEPQTKQVRKEKRVFGRKVVWHEPRVVMVKKEKRVPLPNWHDPYVAYRIR